METNGKLQAKVYKLLDRVTKLQKDKVELKRQLHVLAVNMSRQEIPTVSEGLQIDEIIHLSIVTEYPYVTKSDYSAKTRKREIVQVRQLFQYLMYKYSANALTAIGLTTGRHYSTIIHARQTVTDLAATDRVYGIKLAKIESRIKASITDADNELVANLTDGTKNVDKNAHCLLMLSCEGLAVRTGLLDTIS